MTVSTHRHWRNVDCLSVAICVSSTRSRAGETRAQRQEIHQANDVSHRHVMTHIQNDRRLTRIFALMSGSNCRWLKMNSPRIPAWWFGAFAARAMTAQRFKLAIYLVWMSLRLRKYEITTPYKRCMPLFDALFCVVVCRMETLFSFPFPFRFSLLTNSDFKAS